MCDTPNGKPTFTRKTVTKRLADYKTGKLFLQTSETEVKWPKSKAKQEIEVVREKLGELASKHLISPTIANRVGYIIQNFKRKFNEKTQYIAYTAPMNYNRTKASDKNTIDILLSVHNNEKLQLDNEQKKELEKLFKEKAWNCLIEYCDESMMDKKICDYLLKNPKNRETYERRKREKQLKCK